MKKRLRWKRQPNDTGLARHVQEERGYDLIYGDEDVANVRPRYRYFHRGLIGYYWYARSDELSIPLKNTSNDPVATVDEAKGQALAYVKQYLQS